MSARNRQKEVRIIIGGMIAIAIVTVAITSYHNALVPASVQLGSAGQGDTTIRDQTTNAQTSNQIALGMLTPTPTPTSTATPTNTPTDTPTPSPTPLGKGIINASATPIFTPTPTPPAIKNTATPTPKPTGSNGSTTPTPLVNASPTATETIVPVGRTVRPTSTPTSGARSPASAVIAQLDNVANSISNATEPLRSNAAAQQVSQQVAQPVSRLGALVALSTLLTSLVTTVPAAGQTLPLLFSTWFGFGILGLRRKEYTYVYNSLTKRPIAGATIRIFDTEHQLLQTKVTDMWGRVRLWLPHGRYFFDVQKEYFRFPSAVVLGNVDGRLGEIYSGGAYVVRSSNPSMLALSVPLDPLGVAYASPGVQKVSFRTRAQTFVETVGVRYELPVLTIGFLLALLAVVVQPTLLNGAFVIAYPILLVVRTVVRSGTSRSWSVLRDVNGKPVHAATVQLFSVTGHKLVETQETDEEGRFSFLVPPGEYQIRVLKAGYGFPPRGAKLPRSQSFYAGGVIRVGGSSDQYIKTDVFVAKRA